MNIKIKIPKRLRWIFPVNKKQRKKVLGNNILKSSMYYNQRNNMFKNFRYFPNTIKYLQKGTNLSFQRDGSFQQAVGSVLALAQFFAVMPLRGVRSDNVSDLSFTWKSIRTVYTGIVFFLACINTLLTIMFVASGKLAFLRIVPVIFHTSHTFALVCFLQLARKWPNLMMQWQAVEAQLPELNSEAERQSLAKQIKMISIVVMTLSLTEHLLNIVAAIQTATKCMITNDDFQNVFVDQLPHIFYFTSYSPTKAILGKFVNVMATFMWTYMDLFIIIISVGLVFRFQQINNNLMKHKGKDMPVSFWIEHRIHYRNICDLCETIDKEVGKITLVSFSNNLWFICVQLLLSLHKQPSPAHVVYFWYSLIFLIIRTLAVSLYAADVHDESKEPLKAFRSVPSESWCVEVAATIITYELVLVQFNTAASDNECSH